MKVEDKNALIKPRISKGMAAIDEAHQRNQASGVDASITRMGNRCFLTIHWTDFPRPYRWL